MIGLLDDDGLVDHLLSIFPYVDFVKYHPDYVLDKGIMVLSKLPFKRLTNENMDWSRGRKAYREAWISKDARAEEYDRPYLVYQFDVNGKSINVIPIHLLNPWFRYIEKSGKALTGLRFFWDTDNPLYNQLRTLTQNYTRDFAGRREPVVILGDFNFPIKALGMNTLFRLKLNFVGLREQIGNSPVTFPSFGLKIDHVFTNKYANVKEAEVLEWTGSDHFPVRVVID